MKCTPKQKLLLAEFSLKNEAQIWWESMNRVHARDQGRISYDIFKKKFDKRYIPNVARDRKATEFKELV